MGWLSHRLAERTSQAAIAVLLTAAGTVATNPLAWAAGCLQLWLALIPTTIPCLIAIFVPEGAGATLATLAAAQQAATFRPPVETGTPAAPSPVNSHAAAAAAQPVEGA